MNLRPAVPEDKPAIIELLKSSLGDSTVPKSPQLWEWKHEQNPFGQSFVLLAEENQQIIGVRAFMQWRWFWKNQQYQAIRAVDTATHPDHQGKGIFKKLTLKQLELCEQEGIHFVFNTPNEQSRPGYLKMGWQQQGKLPLKLKVANGFDLAIKLLLKKPPVGDGAMNATPSNEWEQVLSLFKKKPLISQERLHTDINEAYVRWRYSGNPLYNYGFISDHKNYLLLFRPKEHAKYRELRLTDFILFNEVKSIRSDIRKKVLNACKSHKADVITLSGSQFNSYQRYFGWMGFIPVKPFGPIVTIRQVNKEIDMNQLMQVNNWEFSLGDLELF